MFIITGGGSGIGRALTHHLADLNEKVLIIGRRQQALQETAAYSPLISVCCTDVSNPAGQAAIEAQLHNEVSIKGLIHNAGKIDPICTLQSIALDDWDKVMRTNLNPVLFLTQRLLKKLQGGRVLHVGSGAAHFPVAGWSAYCTSKAALSMLTRCWQLECNDPLFANVMPGIIDTPMQEMIRNSTAMQAQKKAFFMQLKAQDHLIAPATVALFLSWLLLKVPNEQYAAQEWDIYDKQHHSAWLLPSHVVPYWE